MIVALRGLPFDYNTTKVVIRGRENLVFIKELQSELKAKKATLLDEVTQQSSLMTAMNTHGSGYDQGGSFGSKNLPLSSGSRSKNVSRSAMSLASMSQMPN